MNCVKDCAVGNLVQIPSDVPALIKDPVTNSLVDCWIDPEEPPSFGIITNIVSCKEYGEITIFTENEFIYIPFSYFSELTILENSHVNSNGKRNAARL